MNNLITKDKEDFYRTQYLVKTKLDKIKYSFDKKRENWSILNSDGTIRAEDEIQSKRALKLMQLGEEEIKKQRYNIPEILTPEQTKYLAFMFAENEHEQNLVEGIWHRIDNHEL